MDISKYEYYRNDLGVLYCCDCLTILPHLEPVDLVLTDPPYGIGFKYESHDDTPEKYGEFIWERIEAAENILKNGGMVFVFQAMLNVRNLHNWFPRNWRIFAAAKNFVQMRPCAMQYSFDPCVVWWKDGEKPFSKGTASRDFHIGNTANTLNRGAGEGYGHPCPRPLDQIQHIIDQWSAEGTSVLDPFIGSGTTAVACERLKRRWIGIEISEEYCAIAVKRIEAERKQLKLF
jgi:site-specific DNA-methyltransferase (adenine-specific)